MGSASANGAGLSRQLPRHRRTRRRRNALDQLIASLSGVDVAYTSGDTNEARSKLEEATFSWNKVSAAISERETREPKLLLDSWTPS